MRSALEQSNLMRQSIGDMIQGYGTVSDIATREAELPYIGPRQQAAIDALKAASGLDIERTRSERLEQQRVPIKLSDGRTIMGKPELAVLYQRALDEAKADANKLVDVPLPDGRTIKATSGEALKFYEKQIEDQQKETVQTPLGPRRMTTSEALDYLHQTEGRTIQEQQHREVQERLKENTAAQNKAAEEARLAREQREQQRTDERAVKQEQGELKEAEEIETSIELGKNRRGDKLDWTNIQPHLDRFNRLSNKSYAYVRSPRNAWRYRNDYRIIRLPIVTGENGEKYQLTARDIYAKAFNPNPGPGEYAPKDVSLYLTWLYQQLGLNIADYTE